MGKAEHPGAVPRRRQGAETEFLQQTGSVPVPRGAWVERQALEPCSQGLVCASHPHLEPKASENQKPKRDHGRITKKSHISIWDWMLTHFFCLQGQPSVSLLPCRKSNSRQSIGQHSSPWEHQEGSWMAHTALREEKAGILISFFSMPKDTQAMGKGAVVGGAALQGSSPEQRLWGCQVWSHLQVGLSPASVRGCWCGAAKQRETILAVVKFGYNCGTEPAVTAGQRGVRIRAISSQNSVNLVCGITTSVWPTLFP